MSYEPLFQTPSERLLAPMIFCIFPPVESPIIERINQRPYPFRSRPEQDCTVGQVGRAGRRVTNFNQFTAPQLRILQAESIIAQHLVPCRSITEAVTTHCDHQLEGTGSGKVWQPFGIPRFLRVLGRTTWSENRSHCTSQNSTVATLTQWSFRGP